MRVILAGLLLMTFALPEAQASSLHECVDAGDIVVFACVHVWDIDHVCIDGRIRGRVINECAVVRTPPMPSVEGGA